ncbi:MAG: AAA family ATPase [Gallionella sp.]|nr:AAA family ATPase [Gallionella sp.]
MTDPATLNPKQPAGLPRLLRALLADSACYDHPVGKLELIETHISWVVLTGQFVYKIRKPVNLGFLDFSTLTLRHQDCLEELRLNRRLAADYYLEVVAINGSPTAPRINGDGNVFEYAVKMRQFAADATLDREAERGALSAQQIDALAARLAHFHQHECAIAADDTPWGAPERVAMPVAENFQSLSACVGNGKEGGTLAGLQHWCEAEHARLAPLMRQRKLQGRVRECHGDLHLANLAWVDGRLVIFDCLEFSPALRWIDVISEVAFCYMDLLHRNLERLAVRFLNAWLEATGDYQGVPLLRYYAVYRALVRAKVAGLRAAQGCQASRTELAECLHLAEKLSVAGAPQLWITHGLSGSGKTTLSQRWLEQYGLIRLRSDVERKRLFGLDACARGGEAIGLYSDAATRQTFAHLAWLAETLLAAGWPVIVDAAFLQRRERDQFRELAQRAGALFRIVDIRVEADVLRERICQRAAQGSDASDADLRVLEHQLATVLPLDADEQSQVTEVGAGGELTALD